MAYIHHDVFCTHRSHLGLNSSTSRSVSLRSRGEGLGRLCFEAERLARCQYSHFQKSAFMDSTVI